MNVNVCATCGSSGRLLRCSRCQSVFYCSKEHQKSHWKTHKSSCAPSSLPSTSQESVLPLQGSSETEILSSQTEALSREFTESPDKKCAGPPLKPKDYPESDRMHRSVALRTVQEEMCQIIINDLNAYGVCVLDHFVGEQLGRAVLNEVLNMHKQGIFQDGELVSRSANDRTIRSDKITWINGNEHYCRYIANVIGQIDALITRANKMPNNGKLGNYNIQGRTKAMVACYPGSGAHYVKHVDNPNRDGRVITAIYYLNIDWDVKKNGGLLRIFPEKGDKVVADIEPTFDRLIFFWSDRSNPHEVQPSFNTRYAITLWYFDAEEREMACKRFAQNQKVKEDYQRLQRKLAL